MKVERILAAKGRDVVTTEPRVTLAGAVDLLHRHRIGAVVVVDEAGAVAGILSERDVVRAIAERGEAALAEPVSARMTERVITCRGDTAIDDVMGVMTAGKFRHVPVVEGGRLAGLVSIGDVVKHRLETIEAEHSALRDYIATA